MCHIISKTLMRYKDGKSWKCMPYFNLEMTEDFLIEEKVLGTSKFPFKILKIGYHLYSVGSFRNIWSVKRKKRVMNNVYICSDSISRANNFSLVLSQKIFDINREEILNEERKMLSFVKCSHISEYFIKIKRIFSDISYAKNLIITIKKDDLHHDDTVLLYKSLIKEHFDLMSLFQKLISISIIKRIVFDQAFYLPCFIDNRGRQYYGTLISPTFHKLFRYLLEFSHKIDNFHCLENSQFYKEIMVHSHTVVEFQLNDKETYTSIVLFIEVGKFFIKNSSHYIVHTEQIIKTGIINYKANNLCLAFDDVLYLKKIYSMLNDLMNKKINYDSLIYKDATASGLQNFGILSKYKETSLEYLNLNGKNWCDTYKYIIHLYLGNTTKYLNRKYWKSTIMTIPYNASWYSCFISHLNSLREDGIDYNKLPESEKLEIKRIHKKFYSDVKNRIKNEFYEKESLNLMSFQYTKWLVVKIDEYKVNYKQGRDKYTNTLFMLDNDDKATERALEANNMHYLDAQLVKHIVTLFEVITIHDCFGVRLGELHLVMDEVNNYYSEIIKKKTYCIHILI